MSTSFEHSLPVDWRWPLIDNNLLSENDLERK
jgi:hypothetical protein